MELHQKKIENWLLHFNLFPYTQIHASGHTGSDGLKEFIETVQPKAVIPVHTGRPEAFRDFHDNVTIPNAGAK